jgi:hypothetical protein
VRLPIGAGFDWKRCWDFDDDASSRKYEVTA